MKHVLVLCCSAGARSNVMVVNLWLVSLTLSSSMLRFIRKSHLISFKCLQTKSYCNSGTYKLRMHDEQLYNLFKSPLQNVNIVKRKEKKQKPWKWTRRTTTRQEGVLFHDIVFYWCKHIINSHHNLRQKKTLQQNCQLTMWTTTVVTPDKTISDSSSPNSYQNVH